MKRFAPFLILTAGILWGSMGFFVRVLTGYGLTTMEIVALRALVTSVILVCGLFLFKRKLLKIRLRDLWCFIGTGICSIVFFNYCYFKAITLTSMAVAAVLLYTAPAMVMVMSYFLFKEKMTSAKVIALVCTFAGCILVTGLVGDTKALSVGGILVGLGAGFGYALYSIFSRFALERGYESLTISAYTFLFAMIGTIPLADFRLLGEVITADGKRILFAVLFGLLSTVVPYFTYTLGLRYVENGKASIIASVEPVVAALAGILLYQETLSVTGAAGVFLVLGSIILCSR